MSSSLWRLTSKTVLPVSAALVSQYTQFTRCDAAQHSTEDSKPLDTDAHHHHDAKPDGLAPDDGSVEKSAGGDNKVGVGGIRPNEEGDFHGLFPKRQLWYPKVDYPLWDSNWDGNELPTTGDKEEDMKLRRRIRKTGVTRHIILIRHGQYDETHKEDEKRILTPRGRLQAELTGKRLADMIAGAEDHFGPCNVKVLRVSNMARAKETSDIIASHLPAGAVDYVEPDPMLNEGRPCHHIPGGKASLKQIQSTDEHQARIEEAFQKHFFRAPLPDLPKEQQDQNSTETGAGPQDKHEFEIIVCHANVIRYFLCRALQLPPEAWLRYCPFNCSLTYITIRPTGTVSCRMVGDIGHLPYGAATFSQHHGFNW